MKKTILTLTIATAALFSTSAFAQSDCSKAKECRAQKSEASCKKDKPCAMKQKADSCMLNPFAELNLTADQQAKLKELRNKEYRQKTKDIKTPEELRQYKRQAYLDDVKSILTEQQYVQFLENSYVNRPAFGKGMKAGKGPKHHDKNKKKECRKDCAGKDAKDKK